MARTYDSHVLFPTAAAGTRREWATKQVVPFVARAGRETSCAASMTMRCTYTVFRYKSSRPPLSLSPGLRRIAIVTSAILEFYSRYLTSSRTVGRERIGKTRDVCLFDLGYSAPPALILPCRIVSCSAAGNEKARDKIQHHNSQEDITGMTETYSKSMYVQLGSS